MIPATEGVARKERQKRGEMLNHEHLSAAILSPRRLKCAAVMSSERWIDAWWSTPICN